MVCLLLVFVCFVFFLKVGLKYCLGLLNLVMRFEYVVMDIYCCFGCVWVLINSVAGMFAFVVYSWMLLFYYCYLVFLI